LEFLRIPHFYTAFYVYRYAIAISAAMLLAKKLKSGDAGYRRRYLELLRAGRTKFATEALLDLEIDLRSEEPMAYTMKVFAERLSHLRELMQTLQPEALPAAPK
jgi:oligoendopeptidase F